MQTKDTSINYILRYENLRLGDVVLESGHKFHSNAIKTYTKSNFSHAMICVGGTSIIHAEKKGIFSLNPQRLLVKNITDLKVLRPKKELSESEKEKLEFFLRDKVGSLYSVKDALLVAIDTKNRQSTNEYQFCSRLVAQAYNYIGHKIVDNVDFCSPADIEKSSHFYELADMTRKAEDVDVSYASRKNFIEVNQASMYEWLNKTRDLANKKYDFRITKVNDVDNFLIRFNDEDEVVCDYVIQSGYLKDYLMEVGNNEHMHNEEKFITKYSDDIVYAICGEFEHIPSPTDRHIKNYQIANSNYMQTKLKYHELYIYLYKELLGVSLSRFITLFNVSKKLILDGNQDKNLMLVMLRSQAYIESLQTLGIERYNLTSSI